jgi:hypothetical protein
MALAWSQVLANGPYTLDGTEGQAFVDMYACAQRVGLLWNGLKHVCYCAGECLLKHVCFCAGE